MADPLSSQKGLQELEERDWEGITGGGGNLRTPLLSKAEREEARQSYPHENNGTYEPPGEPAPVRKPTPGEQVWNRYYDLLAKDHPYASAVKPR